MGPGTSPLRALGRLYTEAEGDSTLGRRHRCGWEEHFEGLHTEAERGSTLRRLYTDTGGDSTLRRLCIKGAGGSALSRLYPDVDGDSTLRRLHTDVDGDSTPQRGSVSERRPGCVCVVSQAGWNVKSTAVI